MARQKKIKSSNKELSMQPDNDLTILAAKVDQALKGSAQPEDEKAAFFRITLLNALEEKMKIIDERIAQENLNKKKSKKETRLDQLMANRKSAETQYAAILAISNNPILTNKGKADLIKKEVLKSE